MVTSGGATTEIRRVVSHEADFEPVYNLCVADLHTYFVRLSGSDTFVLVHNESFGVYTYGNALLPVLAGEIDDWWQDLQDQSAQAADWLQENASIVHDVGAALYDLGVGIIDIGVGGVNAITGVANRAVVGAGLIAGGLGASELGGWLVAEGQAGIANASLFGVPSTTLAMAGVTGLATVATFGGAGVSLLAVGAVAGAADAYYRSDLSGEGLAWESLVAGVVNGVSNPLAASFGVVGGWVNVQLQAGDDVGLLDAYSTGHRIGAAVGNIAGGLAVTGVAAYRHRGSVAFAVKAMSPGGAAAVAGLAYGRMSSRGWADSFEVAAAASTTADLASVLLMKCFVPGTPVAVDYLEPGGSLTAADVVALGVGLEAETRFSGDGVFPDGDGRLWIGLGLAMLAAKQASVRRSAGRNVHDGVRTSRETPTNHVTSVPYSREWRGG